jgi:hypothetical protein
MTRRPARESEPAAAEERRAELRDLCRPTFDAPRPDGVRVFGALTTGLGAILALDFLVFFAVSAYQLMHQAPLAGEKLLAAAVGLTFALFTARVWYGFLRLDDWRVGLDVPHRVKAYAAAGSAFAASLAAASVALLTFAVCSKMRFLRMMEAVGAADVGKVQVLFSLLACFGYFLLLWLIFQGVMELRRTARVALGMVLTGAVVVAVGGVVADGLALSDALGNRGVTAVCAFVGALSLVALVLELMLLTGPDVARHFLAFESPSVGPAGEPS